MFNTLLNYALIIGILAVWLKMLIRMLQAGKTVQTVNSLPDMPPSENPAQLAVVIAARNEAKGISACLNALLEQDHTNLKIIAVNDRSTDTTDEIIDALARESDGKIEAVHISELPEGWLGKCHALQTGASHCPDAEYILFMDGDVRLSPNTLSRIHKKASETEADQVCAVPDMTADSFWEQSVLNVFIQLAILAFSPARAMKRHTGTYVGVGAFNMVKASMYRKIKEHTFLRLQIVDDIGLGRLIKFAGGKVLVLSGRGMISVKWQESAWETVRGLEKNFFASMGYNTPKTIIAAGGLLGFYWLPWIMTFASSWQFKPFWIAALAIQIFVGFVTAVGSKFNPLQAITGTFGGTMMAIALLRSMIITLKQGGVKWRDNFYPLKDLKKFKL